ncbi:MAG TPA: hypothetical protein PLA54_04465 [Spirochaetota bacterium]|nr:hypothetical protein [Spirochaetota bacterium]
MSGKDSSAAKNSGFKIFVSIVAACALSSCAAPMFFHTRNPYKTDYPTNVTLIFWYGDPRYVMYFKQKTDFLNGIEIDPLYTEYREQQTNRFGKDEKKAFNTFNFYMSIDF